MPDRAEAIRARFEALVRPEARSGDACLGEVCLLIGAEADPTCEVERWLMHLDQLAGQLRARFQPGDEPARKLARLVHFLFDEQAFEGDSEDYYNPYNSYLHQVLARRRGMPITLSVVTIEVARRVGLKVAGVPFPTHFLVRHLGDPDVLIDPFHAGRPLDEDEARQLLTKHTGGRVHFEPTMLHPVGWRPIVSRILRNLAASLERAGDLAGAASARERLLLVLGRR